MKKEVVSWLLDINNSDINFYIRYMIFWKMKGSFKDFQLHVTTRGDEQKETNIELNIETNSIITKSKRLDDFLRSYELLNTLQHEKIQFESTNISNPDVLKIYELSGKLTIKGKSKLVLWKFQSVKKPDNSWNSPKMCFIITGEINRKHWLIGKKTFIGKRASLVSRRINIYCKLELTKLNQRAADVNIQQGIGKSGMIYSRMFNTIQKQK